MKELMELTVSLGSELMTTVRLATGGICSAAGLDLERSEDCKVCVTESLLLLLHAGYRRARVKFSSEEGLRVALSGEGEAGEEHPVPEDEISAALIGALAEEADTRRDGGRVQGVSFKFGL